MQKDDDSQPNYQPEPFKKQRKTMRATEQPPTKAEPNRDCQRCFGDGMERAFDPIDGRVTSILNNHCDHRPFVEGEPMFKAAKSNVVEMKP